MIYLIHFLAACIATVGFAKLFHAPNREILFCGISGGIAWLIYDVITTHHLSQVLGTLVAAFILTVIARLFAVIRKMPVTVYLISGIFPLVPGAGIYNTIYYLITAENGLFSEYGLRTIAVAIAITFGILFGSALPQSLFQKLARNKTQVKDSEENANNNISVKRKK